MCLLAVAGCANVSVRSYTPEPHISMLPEGTRLSVVLRGSEKDVHIPFLVYVLREGSPYEVSFSARSKSLDLESLKINDARLHTSVASHDLLSNMRRRTASFSRPDKHGVRRCHFRFQPADIDHAKNPVVTLEMDLTLQPSGEQTTVQAEFRAWKNSYTTFIVLHYANI